MMPWRRGHPLGVIPVSRERDACEADRKTVPDETRVLALQAGGTSVGFKTMVG